MDNWLILAQDQQRNIFNQASDATGLPSYSIEKDAWVTLVLRMLFTSVLSDQIVFKGGTSLSKGYNLIERFSEDIDLAINREFFGFDGDLTKGEIRKLRRRSHAFTLNEVPEILKTQFEKNSINPDLYEITFLIQRFPIRILNWCMLITKQCLMEKTISPIESS